MVPFAADFIPDSLARPVVLSEAGHGGMLSPPPPLASGSVDEHLLADPPSFNREQDIAELNARIADFFVHHLAAKP